MLADDDPGLVVRHHWVRPQPTSDTATAHRLCGGGLPAGAARFTPRPGRALVSGCWLVGQHRKMVVQNSDHRGDLLSWYGKPNCAESRMVERKKRSVELRHLNVPAGFVHGGNGLPLEGRLRQTLDHAMSGLAQNLDQVTQLIQIKHDRRRGLPSCGKFDSNRPSVF